MPIHHVKMNPVCASIGYTAHLFGQMPEISGQNGWCDNSA
jgi:hypothetical protein